MIRLFSIITLSFLFLVPSQSANAHDLIAPEVRSFIQDNPDASADDIASFSQELEQTDGQGDIFLVPTYQEDLGGFIIGYIELGLWHIVIGLDHILFIITIVLTVSGFRQLLLMSLTFTIAHSLTFILAGTVALSLSSRIVEPLIAFSIVFFAIYSILQKYGTIKNWKKTGYIIFFFGLIHGLGFAGLLQDLRIPEDAFVWSLLLFNIGIEIGQFIVIVLALPVLWYVRKFSKYFDIHIITAIAIAVIALWWTVERIFFG